MYVHTLTFCARPQVTNAQTTELYETLVARLSELDGFLGSALLLSSDTSHGMSLSYWRDAAAADEAGTELLPLLLDQIHELVQQPPDIRGYELLHHALSPQV